MALAGGETGALLANFAVIGSGCRYSRTIDKRYDSAIEKSDPGVMKTTGWKLQSKCITSEFECNLEVHSATKGGIESNGSEGSHIRRSDLGLIRYVADT